MNDIDINSNTNTYLLWDPNRYILENLKINDVTFTILSRYSTQIENVLKSRL